MYNTVAYKSQQGVRLLPDRDDIFTHFGVCPDNAVLILNSNLGISGTMNYIDKTSPKFRLFENEFARARNT